MHSQYLFIAQGNSMNNGVYREAIIPGSLVIGQQILPQDICPGTRKNYVIMKMGDVFITRIKEHDTISGRIACSNLNPDKEKPPDFDTILTDSVKVFSVTHVSKAIISYCL
jgi:hypothetical protein